MSGNCNWEERPKSTERRGKEVKQTFIGECHTGDHPHITSQNSSDFWGPPHVRKFLTLSPSETNTPFLCADFISQCHTMKNDDPDKGQTINREEGVVSLGSTTARKLVRFLRERRGYGGRPGKEKKKKRRKWRQIDRLIHRRRSFLSRSEAAGRCSRTLI